MFGRMCNPHKSTALHQAFALLRREHAISDAVHTAGTGLHVHVCSWPLLSNDAGESACLWWQSQLQMPVLKQLPRPGASFSRLAASSSRSASEMRLGGGLTARLQPDRLSVILLMLYIDARHVLHPYEGYLSSWPSLELPSPGCRPSQQICIRNETGMGPTPRLQTGQKSQ